MENQTIVVSTRVTQQFARVIEQYCRQDAYINCADLLREALREKLQRDAPELYKHYLRRGD